MKNYIYSILFIFLGFQPLHVFSQEYISGELLVQFKNWTFDEEKILLSAPINEVLKWEIISKELKIAKAIFDEKKYTQQSVSNFLKRKKTY